jgi:hypothetical protein
VSLTLDAGPHTVTIYLEESVVDSYENRVKRPSTTGVTVSGCLVQPLSSSAARSRR